MKKNHKYLNNEKKIEKTKRVSSIIGIVLVGLIIIFLSCFGPTVVEWLYKLGNSSQILLSSSFKADEILEYYGVILAFLGTIFLGLVAIWQNKKTTGINDRLLELEESNWCPMADFSLFDKEFSIYTGEVKSTKKYMAFIVEDGYFEITKSNEIKPCRDDFLVWIFECENTSRMKIISLEVKRIRVSISFANGETVNHVDQQNISSLGDECLNPNECKPFIISGIPYTDVVIDQLDDKQSNTSYANPTASVFLDLVYTNAIGDKYLQRISFDAVYFPGNDQVIKPGVWNKKYEKPIKQKSRLL